MGEKGDGIEEVYNDANPIYIYEAISGGLALRHHTIMIIVGKKAGRGVDSSPSDRGTP